MKSSKRFVKPLALIALCAVMMLAGAFASFAAELGNSTGWERTSNGWRYIKRDGYMAADEWMWIGEESTGYRCYFFDGSGNLVTNAITTDGYRVDSSGAWTENGEVQVRMFFDTTRSPFGNEVRNGDSVPPITLSTYLSSLIDVRNSASGFPNRKYIETLENGDVLFFTNNNDIQIKIQTSGQMVTAIETPANLMFMNFPANGIEQSALYENMRNSLTSTVPMHVSEHHMEKYFDDDTYNALSGMIVTGDRYYEIVIGLTQGTDGLYYIYPSSPVFMKVYVETQKMVN